MKFTANISGIDPDEFPVYVQAIYSMLKMSQYVTAGEYFMTLYDEDLDELLDDISKVTVELGLEDPIAVKNVMMLTILLRTAEGAIDMDEDELFESIGIVCTYAAIERLSRIGEVEVFHQNMCVAIDKNSKINQRMIVKKI